MEEEWRKSWLDFRRGGGIAGVTLTVARHNCNTHWQKDEDVLAPAARAGIILRRPCGTRTCRLLPSSWVYPHVLRAGPSGRGDQALPRPDRHYTTTCKTKATGGGTQVEAAQPHNIDDSGVALARKQTNTARGAMYADFCEIGCSFHFD